MGVYDLSPGGPGAQTFLELIDTPASYAAVADLFARVNAGETALEFFDIDQQSAPADTGDMITAQNQGIIIAETGGAFNFRRLDRYNGFLTEGFKFSELSGTRFGFRRTKQLAAVNAPGTVAGKDGNAVDFDGVNQRLDGTDDPDFDYNATDDLVMSLWVRTDVSSTDNFISKKDAGLGPGYIITRPDPPGNRLDFSIFTGASVITVQHTTAWTNGVFHHIVIMRESGTMRIFLDNVAGPSLANTTDMTNAAAFTVGADVGGTRELDGAVDELYIWKGLQFTTGGRRTQFVNDLFRNGTGRFWQTTGTSYQISPSSLFQIQRAGERVPLFSPNLGSITSGNQDLFVMDDGATRDAFFELTLPRELVLSTNNPTATFWLHTTTTGTAGNVRMEAAIQSLSPADLATEVAVETQAQTVAITNVQDTIHRIEFTFDRTNLVFDDKMVVRISRLGADAADTFTGDIGISKEARWRMSA